MLNLDFKMATNGDDDNDDDDDDDDDDDELKSNTSLFKVICAVMLLCKNEHAQNVLIFDKLVEYDEELDALLAFALVLG